MSIVKKGVKSLGYGFVLLQDQTAAGRAIYALDGKHHKLNPANCRTSQNIDF
ncbi:RNA-binding protein [Pedobacter africanus]|uniref:hypothetical protein n=1 Tax=Pedobacter africanus TaxID=151894 RepID=UPI00373FD8DD